jgi:hypothetical protein
MGKDGRAVALDMLVEPNIGTELFDPRRIMAAVVPPDGAGFGWKLPTKPWSCPGATNAGPRWR